MPAAAALTRRRAGDGSPARSTRRPALRARSPPSSTRRYPKRPTPPRRWLAALHGRLDARLRRRAHRARRAPLEGSDQRERQGAGLRRRASRARTTTSSWAGRASRSSRAEAAVVMLVDPQADERLVRRAELTAAYLREHAARRRGRECRRRESPGASRLGDLSRRLGLVLPRRCSTASILRRWRRSRSSSSDLADAASRG